MGRSLKLKVSIDFYTQSHLWSRSIPEVSTPQLCLGQALASTMSPFKGLTLNIEVQITWQNFKNTLMMFSILILHLQLTHQLLTCVQFIATI
jgi:hypothetical protein